MEDESGSVPTLSFDDSNITELLNSHMEEMESLLSLPDSPPRSLKAKKGGSREEKALYEDDNVGTNKLDDFLAGFSKQMDDAMASTSDHDAPRKPKSKEKKKKKKKKEPKLPKEPASPIATKHSHSSPPTSPIAEATDAAVQVALQKQRIHHKKQLSLLLKQRDDKHLLEIQNLLLKFKELEQEQMAQLEVEKMHKEKSHIMEQQCQTLQKQLEEKDKKLQEIHHKILQSQKLQKEMKEKDAKIVSLTQQLQALEIKVAATQVVEQMTGATPSSSALPASPPLVTASSSQPKPKIRSPSSPQTKTPRKIPSTALTAPLPMSPFPTKGSKLHRRSQTLYKSSTNHGPRTFTPRCSSTPSSTKRPSTPSQRRPSTPSQRRSSTPTTPRLKTRSYPSSPSPSPRHKSITTPNHLHKSPPPRLGIVPPPMGGAAAASSTPHRSLPSSVSKKVARSQGGLQRLMSGHKESDGGRRYSRMAHLHNLDFGEMNAVDDVRLMIVNVPVTPRLKKMIKSLKIELLDENIENTSSATHVIAGDKDHSLRRTPKLMICLCVTPFILHLDWLIHSYEQKTILQPAPDYLLLHDTLAENRYRFDMLLTIKEGMDRRMEGGLLAGWSIFFCDGVAGNNAPKPKDLHCIVSAAGGTILTYEDLPLSYDVDKIHVLVITSDPPTKEQNCNVEAVDLAKQGAGMFTTTWLFDCMIHQKLFGIKRGLGSMFLSTLGGGEDGVAATTHGGRKKEKRNIANGVNKVKQQMENTAHDEMEEPAITEERASPPPPPLPTVIHTSDSHSSGKISSGNAYKTPIEIVFPRQTPQKDNVVETPPQVPVLDLKLPYYTKVSVKESAKQPIKAVPDKSTTITVVTEEEKLTFKETASPAMEHANDRKDVAVREDVDVGEKHESVSKVESLVVEEEEKPTVDETIDVEEKDVGMAQNENTSEDQADVVKENPSIDAASDLEEKEGEIAQDAASDVVVEESEAVVEGTSGVVKENPTDNDAGGAVVTQEKEDEESDDFAFNKLAARWKVDKVSKSHIVPSENKKVSVEKKKTVVVPEKEEEFAFSNLASRWKTECQTATPLTPLTVVIPGKKKNGGGVDTSTSVHVSKDESKPEVVVLDDGPKAVDTALEDTPKPDSADAQEGITKEEVDNVSEPVEQQSPAATEDSTTSDIIETEVALPEESDTVDVLDNIDGSISNKSNNISTEQSPKEDMPETADVSATDGAMTDTPEVPVGDGAEEPIVAVLEEESTAVSAVTGNECAALEEISPSAMEHDAAHDFEGTTPEDAPNESSDNIPDESSTNIVNNILTTAGQEGATNDVSDQSDDVSEDKADVVEEEPVIAIEVGDPILDESIIDVADEQSSTALQEETSDIVGGQNDSVPKDKSEVIEEESAVDTKASDSIPDELTTDLVDESSNDAAQDGATDGVVGQSDVVSEGKAEIVEEEPAVPTKEGDSTPNNSITDAIDEQSSAAAQDEDTGNVVGENGPLSGDESNATEKKETDEFAFSNLAARWKVDKVPSSSVKPQTFQNKTKDASVKKVSTDDQDESEQFGFSNLAARWKKDTQSAAPLIPAMALGTQNKKRGFGLGSLSAGWKNDAKSATPLTPATASESEISDKAKVSTPREPTPATEEEAAVPDASEEQEEFGFSNLAERWKKDTQSAKPLTPANTPTLATSIKTKISTPSEPKPVGEKQPAVSDASEEQEEFGFGNLAARWKKEAQSAKPLIPDAAQKAATSEK
uniref:BRCT domain-containing protein n=1 Tax=Ditylum brightwellii TaxID=49249 RepID=A0A7S4RTQ9_9STRA